MLFNTKFSLGIMILIIAVVAMAFIGCNFQKPVPPTIRKTRSTWRDPFAFHYYKSHGHKINEEANEGIASHGVDLPMLPSPF
jgi:hypothetical protein